MCDWSNWQFICEGRYDILLAILTGTALFCSVTMMLISVFGGRYRSRHSFKPGHRSGTAAFLSGESKAEHATPPRKTR
ncbi:MAG TPA: hypothetical protein VF472_05265 [Burkholderiaceae bacterium]